MMTVQSFSAYDGPALRELIDVLFDVNRQIELSLTRPFRENERADVTRLVADRLMRAFDLGERNRDALVHAALEGFVTIPRHKILAKDPLAPMPIHL
jgi:hypothetical protein